LDPRIYTYFLASNVCYGYRRTSTWRRDKWHFDELAIVLNSAGGASPSAVELRFPDDSDAATFNAAVKPGACTGNGGTTFQKFTQELQEEKIAGAWRINPDNTGSIPASLRC
jgi:hypothetical protein